MYDCPKVILKREEKKKLVIQMAEAGKPTRYIAQVAHIFIKRHWNDNKKTHRGRISDCQGSSKSLYSRAFKLFKEGKNLVDIAIILDMEADEILGFIMTICGC